METEDKTAVTLYLKQEANIEQIRKDVENLMRTDLNLSHKQDMLGQKMDAMRERLDEGVSKTAWKTHEDVQEIKTLMIDIRSKNALRDQQVKTNTSELDKLQALMVDIVGHSKQVGTNTKNLDKLQSWVYWIAGVGVCGGLVGIAISLVKNPPW